MVDIHRMRDVKARKHEQMSSGNGMVDSWSVRGVISATVI